MAVCIDEEIVHYVIASSIFITMYPLIFVYSGYLHLTPEEQVEKRSVFAGLLFGLPLLFGILFASVYRLLGIVPRKYNGVYLRYIVAGSVSGFLISLILHYGFHIQDTWLNMENPELSHILTPLFYFVFFYTFGSWIRAQILYGSTPSSSTSSSSPSSSPPKPTTSLSTYDKLAQMSGQK